MTTQILIFINLRCRWIWLCSIMLATINEAITTRLTWSELRKVKLIVMKITCDHRLKFWYFFNRFVSLFTENITLVHLLDNLISFIADSKITFVYLREGNFWDLDGLIRKNWVIISIWNIILWSELNVLILIILFDCSLIQWISHNRDSL